MKKYLIPAIIVMAFCSCKHKDEAKGRTEAAMLVLPPKPKMDQVKFPPPEVKADKEEVAGNTYEKNSDGGDSTAMAADTTKEYASIEPEKAAGNNVKDTAKKIIKQGDIRFEARDVAATRRTLLNALRTLGGYADEDNQSLSSDSDRKEYNIKARIPAKNFDTFVDAVMAGAARIDYKHISISDVTSDYIDTKTRLYNQKILEATYIGLLKKASRMKDILDIEDKITDTRTEIESDQGQLNYMSKQIAYSTLDITFYTQSIERETGTGAGYRFSTAFSEGWTIMQALFYGIVTLWPFDILAIGIFMLLRSWRKRRKITAIQE